MPDLGLQVFSQGNNFFRLLQGAGVTIGIAFLSVLISLVLGLIWGIWLTRGGILVRTIGHLYLEFIRIMPQLVLLFLVYFGLSKTLHINLSGWTASIIVFSLWGIAEMGDLVQAAIHSLPPHQSESGLALGLSKNQLYRYIILPQVFRRLLPQMINLITRMIKTTSLVVLIGVVEMVKVGQQIIESNRLAIPKAAFAVYGTIFLLYFAICFPISKLASYLETHWRD
ncbi:amino acid ABC transporter permease [Streptococcus sciuri]|uniref:Amino acid ABC transporter permease n=1 Tax=Streptococcus sciuri TaxID=2973939 RepID=A0ABT2F806_9STRE|nr:amino acid ABC transporter permease [Streptococcus sciuri]MCS4488525.1 amino acid ABC transporter permease [Streptococcus sciuri]